MFALENMLLRLFAIVARCALVGWILFRIPAVLIFIYRLPPEDALGYMRVLHLVLFPHCISMILLIYALEISWRPVEFFHKFLP